MNPIVSVIIPTYNREQFLPKAINSVLNQSFKDFELIILDDGSNDNTKELINKYDDKRIHYHYIDHLGNISSIRNLALELSRGEYIAFLDSDDLWLKDKLAIQIAILRQNQNSFVLTDFTIYNSNSNVNLKALSESNFGKKEPYYESNAFWLLINNEKSYYPSTLIFPKYFLQTIKGFDESLKESGMEFIGRMSLHFKLFFLPERTTIIRKHESNYSKQSHKENFKEKHLLIEKGFKKRILTKKQYDQAILKHHFAYITIPQITLSAMLEGIKDCFVVCSSLSNYFELVKSIAIGVKNKIFNKGLKH